MSGFDDEGAFSYGYEQEEDDVPWADPAIRLNYEAALGAFILAFNEMDYFVGQIIGWDLTHSGRGHVERELSSGPFAARLDILTAVAADFAELAIERMRAINGDRNLLAHGHFDQNPFDGSYTLILKQRAREYPVERINALTAEVGEITHRLRGHFYRRHFEENSAQLALAADVP